MDIISTHGFNKLDFLQTQAGLHLSVLHRQLYFELDFKYNICV